VDLNLPDPDLVIDPQLSTLCYRVLQESLTNVARHADAKHVRIILEYSDAAMRLQVTDDGKGFDLHAAQDGRRLGLLGMRERASMANGHLMVNSLPGAGTSIEMAVPRPDAPAH
jgi:signal transduction histidine kinase